MPSALFAPQRRGLGDPGQPLIPTRSAGRGGGPPVTFGSALTISTVWACVRLRADVVSTLPIDLFRRGPDGAPIEVPKPTVLVQPSAVFAMDEWLYATQVSLDLRGNAYGVIVNRDSMQRPTQIELQHPDTVQVRERDGVVRYKINGKPVPTEDMWHERQFPVPGSVLGLSVIAAAARTMGVQLSAETFGQDWFDSSAHPSAVLKSKSSRPINQKAARIIKDRFLAAMRGTREPIVISGDWEYEQLQVAANESQFLETMKFGVPQICRFFATPPEMVGGESGGSMDYSNREQRVLDWLSTGVGPVLRRRERALDRLSDPANYTKFNVGALLRTDLLTRYKAHQIAIGSKFETPDEVRDLEDMAPLTDEQKAQLQELNIAAPIHIETKGGDQ